MCLGGSPAGISFARLSALTLAAVLATCGAVTGFGQAQPDAAKPAKPVTEKKPVTESPDKIVGGYLVHQSLEVGGRYTNVSGSEAMWATLVNQTSGGRILSQSLEMHSVDRSKTRFFDTLSTGSTGYGGDPYDVSYFKASKGRAYDFTSSFRRDRNYFDYNLMVNSLLGPTALVPEPSTLHLYNTVRRNTDTLLTLFPLSIVSFRAGYNHGTHEGPAFTSVHEGADAQLAQWFRNAEDTYTGGVDVKVAKRTTLSYDQFLVYYKGDSSFQLAGANYQLSNGTPVSLGVDTLSTATCGSGASKTLEVVNGIANPNCNGFIAMSQTAPTRTSFPTEQLRFSSHYWDRVSMNARVLYSGATGSVNHFNETFNGLTSRTFTREEIDTGGFANGQLAKTKRVNVNGDFGLVAELTKFLAVSETFDYWNFRAPGSNNVVSTVYAGSAAAPPNLLTPLSSLTPTTTTTLNSAFLNQKIESNTVMAMVTVIPQLKVSGGWRFKNREITDEGPDDLTWHENWAILGAVIQPSRVLRLNLNFDSMGSKNANALTPSNTYTREAPNKSYHIRARATVLPAKWINFAVAVNDYEGKNDDPLVNHKEHSHDFSFATSIMPVEGLSLDFNYAHDDVYSKTDLCYVYLASATTPLPPGATNAGTCVPSATNPTATANLFLGNGLYDAPSNFFSGAVYYAPKRYFHFGGGVRLNDTGGAAEQLNPLMVPGALQSNYLTPFVDAELKIASQWAWHGNWTRYDYSEQGAIGLLPPRNTTGDVTTLGVKYAF
jgi:hypothetical protein